MKLISTKTHALTDYIIGLMLIASPWIFNFATQGPEMWIPMLIGFYLLTESVFTRYENGIFPLLPMQTHLIIDIAAGVFLSFSPWLFRFDELISFPHLFIGLLISFIAIMSTSKTTYAVIS